ncbi:MULTISPECIES: DUF72 domain-containing protein [Nocardioides]|uniref:DUF72 domain-containing protein n=1 Tax=Nocardioides TaxID=1839 RepID=UPI00032D6F85|nr:MULTISPECIES: DUF72 domain-containing protein [Nocardioides]EON23423.1 hypothetical protein CF8_2638 [Nocardioides sp. CF8]
MTPPPGSDEDTGSVWVGTSGWQYDSWRGDFYPEGLPRTKQLAYAATQLNTMELNGSFYSLQRPASYRRWHDATPAGFLFAVKGGRHITHFKRLRDVEVSLANFFASGVTLLGDKLGPILWQLPERVEFDRDVLAEFLGQLPRSVAAATVLARRNDRQLDTADLTASRRPLRHALEVRHRSFRDDDFLGLLDEHDVACVVADSAGKWPMLDESTGSFDYVRLHGHTELYASRYSDRLLDTWADRCRAGASAGRDVHVYFDNDMRGHAPHDAVRLSQRLGLRP